AEFRFILREFHRVTVMGDFAMKGIDGRSLVAPSFLGAAEDCQSQTKGQHQPVDGPHRKYARVDCGRGKSRFRPSRKRDDVSRRVRSSGLPPLPWGYTGRSRFEKESRTRWFGRF